MHVCTQDGMHVDRGQKIVVIGPSHGLSFIGKRYNRQLSKIMQPIFTQMLACFWKPSQRT